MIPDVTASSQEDHSPDDQEQFSHVTYTRGQVESVLRLIVAQVTSMAAHTRVGDEADDSRNAARCRNSRLPRLNNRWVERLEVWRVEVGRSASLGYQHIPLALSMLCSTCGGKVKELSGLRRFLWSGRHPPAGLHKLKAVPEGRANG